MSKKKTRLILQLGQGYEICHAVASRVELGEKTWVEVPVGRDSENFPLTPELSSVLNDPLGRVGVVYAISPRGRVIPKHVGKAIQARRMLDFPNVDITLVFEKG